MMYQLTETMKLHPETFCIINLTSLKFKFNFRGPIALK